MISPSDESAVAVTGPSTSDSSLLRIPSVKLCDTCGQLKTLAKIINETKRDDGLRETESTTTIVAYPQESYSTPSISDVKNILTASQRLSSLAEDEDVESIESIGQTFPIKKTYSIENYGQIKKVDRKSTKEAIDVKMKDVDQQRLQKTASGLYMAVSLTDLDMLEASIAEQKKYAATSIKEHKSAPPKRYRRNFLSRISNAFRSKSSQ